VMGKAESKKELEGMEKNSEINEMKRDDNRRERFAKESATGRPEQRIVKGKKRNIPSGTGNDEKSMCWWWGITKTNVSVLPWGVRSWGKENP